MKEILLNQLKIDKRQSISIPLQIAQSIKQILFERTIKYLAEMPTAEQVEKKLDVHNISDVELICIQLRSDQKDPRYLHLICCHRKECPIKPMN